MSFSIYHPVNAEAPVQVTPVVGIELDLDDAAWDVIAPEVLPVCPLVKDPNAIVIAIVEDQTIAAREIKAREVHLAERRCRIRVYQCPVLLHVLLIRVLRLFHRFLWLRTRLSFFGRG